jgi:hypothetical protein
MPGKEVGHDKKRSLVVPMGVSLSELPGGVGGGRLGTWVHRWRATGSPELFVREAPKKGQRQFSRKLRWESRGDSN